MTRAKAQFFFFLLAVIFLLPLRVSAMPSFRGEEKKDASRGANKEQAVPIQRHQERGTIFSSMVEEEKSPLDEIPAADQEKSKEESTTALTLDDFKVALEQYPNAGRFIVVREANGNVSIQSREESPNRFGRSRDENQATIDTLRNLIPKEFGGDSNLASLLAYRRGVAAMAMHIDPLTPTRLRDILNRVEENTRTLAGPMLEDFQAAASTYEGAERLIMDPITGEIRPWNEGDSKVSGKDKTIIEALTKSLSITFPDIAVEEIIKRLLPSPSMLEKAQGKKVILSAETLERILETVQEAAAEKSFVEEAPLGLAQFRFACCHPNNRGAERLIITGQGVHARIEAQAGKDHRKDRQIRTMLKEALRREGHHQGFIKAVMSEVLPSSRTLIGKISPPLSLEKLIRILQKAEEAMQKQHSWQSTHSIVIPSPAVRNRVAMRNALRSVIEASLRNVGIEARGFAEKVSEGLIKKNPEERAAEHARELEQDRLEKVELEQILRSLIHRDRDLDFLNTHFHDAEEAALAAEDGDERAMRARWDAEKNEKLLAHARELFEKLKAVLEEKNNLADLGIEESILSQVSQGADLAGVVLGMFNIPLVNAQGIATAIATFAKLADRHFTIAEAREAYRTLQQAIQADQEATAGSEKLDELASQRRIGAKAQEEAKQQEIREEVTRFGKLLTALPKDNSNEKEWHQWATDLICETDLTEEEAPIKTYLLSKQAKKNRIYVLLQIAKLWVERMKFTELMREKAAHEAATILQRARDHYQRLREEEQKVEAEASAARTRFEEATKAKAEWLSKKEELRREQATLEKEWEQGAVEREETSTALTAKKEALDTYQTKKEKIDQAYQEAAAQAKELSRRAATARTKAFEGFQRLDRLEKAHARRQNRFKTCTVVDQAGLNEVKALCSSSREPLQQSLRSAVWCYNKATQAEARGSREEADRYRESAQAFEEAAAALKDEMDELQRFKADNRNNAAQAEAQGRKEEADRYREIARDYWLRTVSFTFGQQNKVANLHKKRAQRFKDAAKSYVKANEAEARGSRKEADLYRKSAQANEAEAAALERREEEVANLHKERAEAFRHAAESYNNAAQAEAQGRKEEAYLYIKCSQAWKAEGGAREQQIEALAHDDKEQAKLYEKRTEAPESTGESYNEAAQREARFQDIQDSDSETFIYEPTDFNKKRAEAFGHAAKNYNAAAEAEAQEKKKVADLYCRSAQAHEASAAALERREEGVAELHKDRAWAFRNAAESYNNAAQAEAQGRKEEAYLYRKCSQSWRAAGKAREQQIEALAHDDKEQAKLYEKRTEAPESTGESYNEAAQRESRFQDIQDSDSEMFIIDKPAGFNGKRAWAFRNAAESYNNAAQAEARGSREKEADCYRRSAQAHEASAAALEHGEIEVAELHEDRAWAFRNAAESYNNAAQAEAQASREKEADCYRRSAQAHEASAAALECGEKKVAELHERRARRFEGAAYFYNKASKANAQSRREEADLYRKSAQDEEATAAALARQIEALEQKRKPSAPAPNQTRPNKENPVAPKKENCIIS